MRNEHSQRQPRTTRTSSSAGRTDLADWRRLTRPLILDDFIDRTRDLPWSRELIDLLLDELHISDEFDDLIRRIPPAQINYPQLVALALVLRHSWFPEDLAHITAALEPPSSSPPSTTEGLDSPQVTGIPDRPSTTHSISTHQGCTP